MAATSRTHAPAIPWWNEGMEDLLRELWPVMSAAQIAEAMGYPGRRNAIIGKAHRLGLHESMPKKDHKDLTVARVRRQEAYERKTRLQQRKKQFKPKPNPKPKYRAPMVPVPPTREELMQEFLAGARKMEREEKRNA